MLVVSRRKCLSLLGFEKSWPRPHYSIPHLPRASECSILQSLNAIPTRKAVRMWLVQLCVGKYRQFLSRPRLFACSDDGSARFGIELSVSTGVF